MMKLHRILMAVVVAAAPLAVAAADFDSNFSDSTLRLDYIFGGGPQGPNIMLQQQRASKGWAGRRHNLERLPLLGNGQITVTDAATGDTIYCNPFSTLYSEWLVTEEAESVQRSFQNTMLVPLPRREADITIQLIDYRQEPFVKMTHRYRPDDVLVNRTEPNAVTPHRYLHRAGNPAEAIDVAILAEGYTVEEMDSFYVHAQRAVDEILSYEPFKRYADKMNFVAVASPSQDSGVSIPRFNQWRNTAFGSHFSTFYSDRYLTVPEVFAVHNALAGIPYEHLIILANTEEYGGSGIFNNYHLASSRNRFSMPVIVHEFGHSFGGLADEYFYGSGDIFSDMYPSDIEPWEPNITTLKDFDSKWADMVDKKTPIPTPAKDAAKYGVGVYEGGGYATKGVFRPVDECRMRNNSYPSFCPVCQRGIERIILFYTE